MPKDLVPTNMLNEDDPSLLNQAKGASLLPLHIEILGDGGMQEPIAQLSIPGLARSCELIEVVCPHRFLFSDGQTEGEQSVDVELVAFADASQIAL
eukprot:1567298-Alexandrium_andersonii.AAC.1